MNEPVQIILVFKDKTHDENIVSYSLKRYAYIVGTNSIRIESKDDDNDMRIVPFNSLEQIIIN